jgi:hypothetical protein
MWLYSLHIHVHTTVLDIRRSLSSNPGVDGINSFSVMCIAAVHCCYALLLCIAVYKWCIALVAMLGTLCILHMHSAVTLSKAPQSLPGPFQKPLTAHSGSAVPVSMSVREHFSAIGVPLQRAVICRGLCGNCLNAGRPTVMMLPFVAFHMCGLAGLKRYRAVFP